MLKAFFDFLATELTLTKGTDFHKGYTPAKAQANCTTLMARVGATTAPDTPSMAWHRFQFLTRNESYSDGDTEANRIFDIVVRLRGETLTGWYLYDVTGQRPAYLGQDDKGRHEFSANVIVSARKD